MQQDRLVQPVAAGQEQQATPTQQEAPVQPTGQAEGADCADMKAELADSRQAIAQKDQQIALLMQELDAIRKDQDEIKALLKAKFPT